MLAGAAEVCERAEVKGFAARQFKEVLTSSLAKVEFVVLFPLPLELELPFVLGVLSAVPVPGLPCYTVEVGQVCCEFSGVVRTLEFINSVM